MTTTTSVNRIYKSIAEQIITGNLQPGEKLEEKVLASRFGVSRTPIREALRELSARGLINLIPRRGGMVAEIGLERLSDMLDAECELEGLCARLAAMRMTALEKGHDAEQAAEMVRATRYPPDGVRGVGAGLARAARWGRTADYLERAGNEICLLLQVESRAGIANAEAIAAVPGVDGVFIGPSDLAAAFGQIGQTTHPEVVAAIESGIAAIRRQGKAAGILAVDEPVARRYLELGCGFVAVGTDVSLLARNAERLAKTYKK